MLVSALFCGHTTLCSVKPFNTLEAAAVAQAALSNKENDVGLAVVFSDDGQAAGVCVHFVCAVKQRKQCWPGS
jgi:hypothetical protein